MVAAVKSESDTRFVAACVQFDVARGEPHANLARAERGLRQAAEAGATFCVLPEMWTTSFVSEWTSELEAASRDAEARVRALSAELGILVIGSAPHFEDGKVFNRAEVVDRGEVLGEYRKIHLFSPNAEHRIHEAGNEPLILDTRFGRVGVVICYDIRFPELIRYYFYEGVEILAVPAQWPEARAAHWRSLLTARAIDPSGDYRLINDGDFGPLDGGRFDVVLSAFTFDNVPAARKPAGAVTHWNHWGDKRR